MKAKINEKILCIPPYISTSWDQILFLQTETHQETGQVTLMIHLIDEKIVKISNLEASLIEIAFSAHMQYLEKKENSQKMVGKLGEKQGEMFQNLLNEQTTAFPLRLGITGLPNFEGLEMAAQHNSAQADAPDLPPEVLEKIVGITKIITNGDTQAFPKPEPHCNCMHCQIARAFHGNISSPVEKMPVEETVLEEDLKFRSWDIVQIGENLFTVTNPLDFKEKYNVYLGSPVGCTCGSPDCEHIKAVLYS